jgi:hypothetical protein
VCTENVSYTNKLGSLVQFKWIGRIRSFRITYFKYRLYYREAIESYVFILTNYILYSLPLMLMLMLLRWWANLHFSSLSLQSRLLVGFVLIGFRLVKCLETTFPFFKIQENWNKIVELCYSSTRCWHRIKSKKKVVFWLVILVAIFIPYIFNFSTTTT